MLSFVEGTRGGRRLADLAEVATGRSRDDAARAVADQCPGWCVSTRDEQLVAALQVAGANLTRHVHLMFASTQPGRHEHPTDVLASVTLHPFADFAWADIIPSWKAAYPVGHPDHVTGTDTDLVDMELRPYVEAEALGPVHRSTTLAVIGGRVAGAIVISLRPEPAPFGGPWITEVWRDPESPARGLGAALIGRAFAMLHEDGFGTLGLAVTDANPARTTYERLGFEPTFESWTIMIPDEPDINKVTARFEHWP
ncbi:MAG: GNAT family N-acetyltransferase [Actinobacteria bacterium]|nr:GNAT family N-acetyltransferase [Actinomycetota bacterium]